jgi:NAD(P)H-hydrate epimerase
MERAALAVVAVVMEFRPTAVLVLAGSGNNGGDGYAVARLLRQRGVAATALRVGPEPTTADARAQIPACEAVGVDIVDAADHTALRSLAMGASVWVDAILGTGLTLPLREPVAGVLRLLRTCRTRDTRIVAVDVPTGVSADSGECDPSTLQVDRTVTFGALRWGHLLPPAVGVTGQVIVADIGLLPPGSTDAARGQYPAHADLGALPAISGSDYKGVRGHVLVHAGSEMYPGAGVLAARAALHAGAGLVTLIADSLAGRHVASQVPELIQLSSFPESTDLEAYSAFLVGPGLHAETATRTLRVLTHALKGRPLVLDAGALDALKSMGEGAPRGANIVLTPHPGELARLLGRSPPDVLEGLPAATVECAETFGCICATKSSVVLVARPGSAEIAVVERGHAATGRGGAGDVLAGAIAGLAAHRGLGGESATIFGATAHARASFLAWEAAGAADFTPSDLSRCLPRAITSLRAGAGDD